MGFPLMKPMTCCVSFGKKYGLTDEWTDHWP